MLKSALSLLERKQTTSGMWGPGWLHRERWAQWEASSERWCFVFWEILTISHSSWIHLTFSQSKCRYPPPPKQIYQFRWYEIDQEKKKTVIWIKKSHSFCILCCILYTWEGTTSVWRMVRNWTLQFMVCFLYSISLTKREQLLGSRESIVTNVSIWKPEALANLDVWAPLQKDRHNYLLWF